MRERVHSTRHTAPRTAEDALNGCDRVIFFHSHFPICSRPIVSSCKLTLAKTITRGARVVATKMFPTPILASPAGSHTNRCAQQSHEGEQRGAGWVSGLLTDPQRLLPTTSNTVPLLPTSEIQQQTRVLVFDRIYRSYLIDSSHTPVYARHPGAECRAWLGETQLEGL